MSRYTIADVYEVYLDQPLKEFETETVRAFACKDLRQPELSLVCLKTSVFPPPRIQLFDKFLSLSKAFPTASFMTLQHYGNEYLSSTRDSKSMVLIYQRPNGNRVISDLHQHFTPWTEEEIIERLVKPVNDGLTLLGQYGLAHQCVLPTNMYLPAGDKLPRIKLGDCLASPPGLYQHPFFEPIEYAMTEPIAKGEAAPTNDLFALGATVAYLANGGFPTDIDFSKLAAQRIELGTLAAYAPKTQQSGRIYELLRGLLQDNKEHRWGPAEIGQWLTAGRPTAAISPPPRRASRPLSFNGKEDVYTINTLFVEMVNAPLSALELMNKNVLPMWLKNGLNDNHRMHQLDDLNALLVRDSTANERLMGVLQILYPGSPLFWQGKFYAFNGLGMVFCDTVLRNDNYDSLTALLSSSILPYYMNTDNAKDLLNNEESTTFNYGKALLSAKTFLNYAGVGGGVERAIYHMSPFLPCLSPIVRQQNVYSVPELLHALDDIGHRTNKPELPVDRHIIAFIFSKETALKQSTLNNLSSSSQQKNVRGILRLLAELQNRTRIKQLTGLCKWFGEISEPVVESFKNQKYKSLLRRKLQTAIESGNLSGLIKLLDNHKAIESDIQGLRAANLEVSFIDKTVQTILKTAATPKHYSETIGQNNAMIMAAALSFAASGIYIFIKAAL
ncbi:hypothetical protein [Candidatus Odyssella thessalonicensis]|uniref:hypothetical protein n=1 Tax=Candidatus Odyssella thessalonicensis TaxID=84647 RepID=UPI000225B6CF|nr:hypothetical protein [Candidatus Odyssella thessalonicensis]